MPMTLRNIYILIMHACDKKGLICQAKTHKCIKKARLSWKHLLAITCNQLKSVISGRAQRPAVC